MSRSIILQRWYNIIRFHGGRTASCCCTRKASSGPLEHQSNMYAPLTFSMTTTNNSGSLPLNFVWPASRNVFLRGVPVRYMSSVSDSDSDDEFDIILHEREIKDPTEVFRSSLYPNSEDPLILKLNESKSVQDVFIFLHKNQDNLTSSHISQAVLVLWDLQRVFMQVSVDHNPIDNLSELQKYVKAVSGHPDFHNLLRLVKSKYNDLNPDALTCTLLYLIKMDVDKTHPTVEVLLQRCESELLSFPLTAISRFLVAVQGGQLWTIAITQTVVPLVLKQLAECEDAEQFRLLTICISNIHHYVTPNVMNMYKTRVKFLLDAGIIGPKNPRTIVKIIQFLDFPRWSMLNASLIVELMHTFSGQIAEQRSGDIITLHRVFQGQLEPVDVLEEIQDYVLKLLEKQDASSLPVEMLACVVPFSSSTTREKIFEDLLKTHIKSPSFPLTMPIVFKILRYLKTSSVDICNLFWGETLKFLSKSEQEDFRLLRICHKYMHFNNNLGGTYRHYEFEKQMLDWLTQLLDKVPGSCPSKLSRIAAFIMGYGQSTIPVTFMRKVEEMAPQFSILDCLNISRGLQIATELRSKYRGAYVVEQLVTISSILSACTRSHLASPKLTLSEVNMLMRTYINMRGVCGTDLFESLVHRYSTSTTTMTSRMLRETTFNLNPHRCLVPTMMEQMVQYVEIHAADMLGDTVEKFLWFCYWLGYIPDSEQFGQQAANAIVRDKEKISGLSLLQAALSLCFIQHLPLALIHHIFTVDFLEHLDAELKLCYSKTSYPIRVRQCLMELNRAVCLDYPQADVPWFHTKYCEELATQDTIPKSSFNNEVLQSLANVVGGVEYVKRNSYTPYFYKLDFEVILDEHQKPIPIKQHHEVENRQVTRVGVLLLREEAFSSGQTQLRGPSLLRRRHLEILNYRQVEISQVLWRAMYMTEESDRQSYIAKHIWPDRTGTPHDVISSTETVPM